MDDKIQKGQVVVQAVLLLVWFGYVVYALVVYENGWFNLLLGTIMTVAAIYYFVQIVRKYIKQERANKDEN